MGLAEDSNAMDLYYLPISPYSHKVQLYLIENDLSHNAIPVNIFDEDDFKQYREFHPIGKLPLLVVGEKKIPESSTIVEYLDLEFPGAEPRIPQDPKQALEVRLKDRWIDQYLSDAAITIFFQMMRPEEQRDQIRLSKSQRYLKATYDYVEQTLADNAKVFGGTSGPYYFHGAQWTLADLALLPALRTAQNIFSFEQYPHIQGYFATHSERDAFKLIGK